MFYTETLDSQLRFGDVVKGFALAASTMEKPIVINKEHNYQIDINFPNLCAILSPCCTISNKTKQDGIIAVSPLTSLKVELSFNPYFKKDFLNVNRKMKPEQSVSPEVWAQLPSEKKGKMELEGISFAFLELFVYQKHEYFSEYSLTTKKESFRTNFLMIDFRNIFKVRCKALQQGDKALSNIKLLQLSVSTRIELREKIADFYGRTPKEDKLLLVE